MRKIKTKGFVITHDHLENEKLSAKQIAQLKKEGYTDHFKMYDDDGEHYYSGYTNPNYDDGESDTSFMPLDWAMYDSGCTDIKYRNKNGQYESL